MPQMDFPGGPVAKTPNAGGPGLISGRGTRLHMPQIKIARAVTKTQGRQIDNK